MFAYYIQNNYKVKRHTKKIQYLILKGQCEIIIRIKLGLVLLNEQEELVTQRSLSAILVHRMSFPFCFTE